jgi:hypothetical protein
MKEQVRLPGALGLLSLCTDYSLFFESTEPFLLPAFALMQSWGHWRVAWRKEISSATSLNELTFLPMENPAAYSYLLFFLPTYLPDLACPFSVIFIT